MGCVVMRQAGLHSRIAELLAAPRRSDVIAPLIAAAAGQAQDAGSLLLSAWSAVGHPLHAQLRRSGFVSPERLHRLAQRWPPLAGFLYQVIAYTAHLSADRQADLIARARAWSLSLGDSDLV
jgi:hypothetical protein